MSASCLGSKSWNTTSYHPQCDGMVERFNRTLKAALRKHTVTFGDQWDTYLSGVLWAYRNTPHDSTGQKPSFLLFGMDCRSPSEAVLLPPEVVRPTDVSDYREQLGLALSSARDSAASSIRKAQKQYKTQFDRKSSGRKYSDGDWVLVRFPQEESGKNRKLSQPWHGPYRVTKCLDPDVIVAKVYFPEHGAIQVHQSRVTVCPKEFPSGFYWYGKKRHSAGRPPKWLQKLTVEDVAAPTEPVDEVQDEDQTVETESEEEEFEADVFESDQDDMDSPLQPSLPRVSSRYSLRNRVSQPQHLMSLTLGSSFLREAGNVE